jgi:hypothetical protein
MGMKETIPLQQVLVDAVIAMRAEVDGHFHSEVVGQVEHAHGLVPRRHSV